MTTMFVTGGVGGLGLSFAKKWLASCSTRTIFLADRIAAASAHERIESSGLERARVSYRELDVCDAGALGAAIRSVEDLGVVVNNAGVGHAGFQSWRETIDINFTATVAGSMSAIECFAARPPPGGGAIVNVASLAGLVPAPFSPVYCASKAAVVSFVRSLHRPLKKSDGVRMHALCPSFADTGLVAEMMLDHDEDEDSARSQLDERGRAEHEKAARFLRKATSMQGGLMHPDVVADALMRLLDDADAKPIMYVTPQTGAEYDDPPFHKAELAVFAPGYKAAIYRAQHLWKTL